MQENGDPPIKQLYEALEKNGRRDIAKTLFAEAKQYYKENVHVIFINYFDPPLQS